MKNIHVLPTEKRSNLFKDINGNLGFHKKWITIPLGRINQNIYITSDEEIKHLDWVYDAFDKTTIYRATAVVIHNIKSLEYPYCKKIILTTDQDLIKDGVQAIDDEFIEWFVKNPSCERVDIKKLLYKVGSNYQGNRFDGYKIIIPKEEIKRKIDTCYNFDREIGCVQDICRCEQEEPKQHVEFINNSIDKLDKAIKSFKQDSLNQFLSTSGVMIKDPQKWEIPKQETLEEVATKEGLYRCSQNNFNQAEAGYNAKWFKRGALFGAKWQQEQIGKSEFLQRLRATISDAEARRLIFEQFKNK